MTSPPIWLQTERETGIDPFMAFSGHEWDLVDDENWLIWQWNYCLLCLGCGGDKDIGGHGMSEYGGCV